MRSTLRRARWLARPEAEQVGVQKWCEALFAIGPNAKSRGPKVDSNNGRLFGAYELQMKP